MRRLPVVVETSISTVKALQTQVGEKFVREMRKVETHTACKRGCDHCCYHPFLITVAEGVLLYRWLLANNLWSTKLRQRLEQHRETTLGLDFDVWLMGKVPCPLLENHQCTAYSARPLHCRVTFSTMLPELCDPHDLGPNTPLIPNVETIVQYSQEVRRILDKLGTKGLMMPLSEAVLMGESIDNGKLPIDKADQQYLKDLFRQST